MENPTYLPCSSACSKLVLSGSSSNRIILLCNQSIPFRMLKWNCLSNMSPLQSCCAGYAPFGCVSDTLHRIHSAGRWYVTSLQITWSTLTLVNWNILGLRGIGMDGNNRDGFSLLYSVLLISFSSLLVMYLCTCKSNCSLPCKLTRKTGCSRLTTKASIKYKI